MQNEILKKIFIEKRLLLRKIFFLTLDVILISLAVFLAFLLRFEGEIPEKHFSNIWGFIILALVVTIADFHFFKLYSFSWSYVSASELIALAKATAFSVLFSGLFILFFRDQRLFVGFPRSVIFISYFLIFIFSGGIRFAKRIYLRIYLGLKKEGKEKVLIVGAGGAGEQILRSILNAKDSPYLPVGFVDDSLAKQGILIHGFKVLGKISDIPEIKKEEKAESLIIAIPSAGSKIIRAAVEQGRRAGLRKIKILPSINEIVEGKIEVNIGLLRQVDMEDLLGREPVRLDQGAIEKFIKDKTVLITGAAGSIGSELCRQIAKFKPALLLGLDQDETGTFHILEEFKERFPELNKNFLIADIQDKEKIDWIFRKFRPEVVFHAAAYKHVPLMEEQMDEALKNNVFGTQNIAVASLKYGTENFIFICTDKAVNPVSVMGATKRIGEMVCQQFNQKGSAKFISVRFGNVLDSRGSVIPIFREQIKKGGPVVITDPEMKRYFMTTSEACLLVMQAGAMGEGGEVFVLDMGEPIRIVDLAREMIKFSGFEPDKDIPIVFSQPRAGEKFFEEILTAEEGTEVTQNQKIFRAKLADIDRNKLYWGLEELKRALTIDEKTNREKTITKILKKLIPSYQPLKTFQLDKINRFQPDKKSISGEASFFGAGGFRHSQKQKTLPSSIKYGEKVARKKRKKNKGRIRRKRRKENKR